MAPDLATFCWTQALVNQDGEYDEDDFEAFEERLLGLFRKSPEGVEAEEQLGDVGFWVHVVFDYGLTFFGRDPSDLRAPEFEEILLDIVPRKVSCRPEAAGEAIAELRAFWTFAAREFEVADAADFESVLQTAQGTLEARLADPANWGMAKSFFMQGQQAGFDMSTEEGLGAFQSLHNAQLLAQRDARDRDAAVARERAAKANKRQRKRRKASHQRNR